MGQTPLPQRVLSPQFYWSCRCAYRPGTNMCFWDRQGPLIPIGNQESADANPPGDPTSGGDGGSLSGYGGRPPQIAPV